MKKWFFSDNGKVSGPLGLKESNELIAKNPDLYAWHPSYTHWVPVSCINEFDLNIKPPAPPVDIPKDLIEGLIDEEKDLISTLDRIDKTISTTSDSLYEIDAEIDNYSQITHNLTEEVKVVVQTIEAQYASLQKNLANVIKTDYDV
ncbi:DUF4339 domain-containing protein [Litorilituus lipolyticus]|uniref:DUF4339 domain-containing protein n=1 Tax=Litorilituus lipolyticus TaxID=2491017 RepID=A0A502L014_9GAMM|nr:DUF4339 domain-containing protein [Litorilituus lipolyticus]TPH13807.1 DUF4339 domain-containing protein [Litorilituus lipolyticus]